MDMNGEKKCICELMAQPSSHAQNVHSVSATWHCPVHGSQKKTTLVHTTPDEHCFNCHQKETAGYVEAKEPLRMAAATVSKEFGNAIRKLGEDAPRTGWEEEFEALRFVESGGCDGCDINIEGIADLKSFISRLLQKQHEEIRGKVSGLEMKIDAQVYIDAAKAAKVAPFDKGVDLGFEAFRSSLLASLEKPTNL
jgi:hypothetical protein